MKKITVLLLLAALLMTAGCGAKQPAETPATPSPDVSVPETEAPVATPEATPEPTPEPVPDCVDAVVQVDRSPAILTLLKRGDQVDVVGEYVQLKKQGRNYFGLCPFHNENSPSFSVAPDKQIFHCCGCGAGGNGFTF